MHPDLRDHLRELADEAGVGYQSLAHDILSDFVASERTFQKSTPAQRLALLAHEVRTLSEKADKEVPKLGEQPELVEAFLKVREAAEALRLHYNLEGDD